jgi:hypothetical protein
MTDSSQQFDELLRTAKELQRIGDSVLVDMRTAHNLRGNGASDAMRDDDLELRLAFRTVLGRFRIILARHGDGESCPVCGNEERGQGGYLTCECPAPLPPISPPR